MSSTPEQSNTVMSSHLSESRVFQPQPTFAEAAQIGSAQLAAMRAQADADPEAYWACAAENIAWRTTWDTVLDWQPPHAKWFTGGTLNATETCLDRHVNSPRKHKAALIWEGEDGEVRTVTYAQLHRDVCAFAGALRGRGLGAGDRVAIYMPMTVEIVVAMLACARVGATHSVVFGGFSAEALRDRINDAGATFVLTADGGFRKGKVVPLKGAVDAALAGGACPSVQTVVVLPRCGVDIHIEPGRDVLWDDLLAEDHPPVVRPDAFDAEHPLFILYTSGTTGKPKGVVHSTGGYLTQAVRSIELVFDMRDDDVFWCTADAGWITGHSYVVYGPLAVGATQVIYEGAPTYPAADRLWEMAERHGVTTLYTAPTAIRTFMRLGDAHVKAHDLSALRLLGTVGEPINPEAWMWYRDVVGGGRCPIVDTWWQTETGSIMISAIPGVTPTTPGSATHPLPGVSAKIVDKNGEPVPPGEGGFLIIDKPWPGMIRTVWGDDARFEKTYFSQVDGAYFPGDGARIDENGNFWIMGRIDDVVNVSGHRLGTMEIESALVGHPQVSEAAVVSRPDPVTGEAIVAFVTLKDGSVVGDALLGSIRAMVEREIGTFARPAEMHFTDALPKTRSGKIMRRLLREFATAGRIQGDTSTLEDRSVLDQLRGDDD